MAAGRRLLPASYRRVRSVLKGNGAGAADDLGVGRRVGWSRQFDVTGVADRGAVDYVPVDADVGTQAVESRAHAHDLEGGARRRLDSVGAVCVGLVEAEALQPVRTQGVERAAAAAREDGGPAAPVDRLLRDVHIAVQQA